MNLTVLENRIAEFNRTMNSIAADLHHFRVLIDKELAEKEARKDREREMYEKRELVHNLVVHNGDGFIVCDEFTLPSTDVDPDNRKAADTVMKGERLTVKKVDCLSNKYDVEITVFRDVQISDYVDTVVLTLDQIRKLVENDILAIVGKNS